MNPSDSESFDREYQALRTGRAVVDLADWSSISITGRDRQTFLQNFCTNDVKRLTPGLSCEAFFTNVKGKIVGHGVVSCKNDELVIFGAPGQAPQLIEHLDRYVIREDVKLLDQTSERAHVIINDVLTPTYSPEVISWNLLGNEVGNIVELPASQAALLIAHFCDNGFVLIGAEAFTAARIEAGIPLFGIDFDDTNLPQEIGRDREAINFTKGCYLGQETVARIDALGHINQKIVGVRFFGHQTPFKNDELTRGTGMVGRITSSNFSPQLGAPLALAMVRREANAVGTRLDSPVGECEVIALPLPPTDTNPEVR